MQIDVTERLDGWLATQPWFKRVTDGVHKALARWRHASPQASAAASDILNGTVLGHSLHAVMTDFPIGMWTATEVLDIAGLLSGSDRFTPAAELTLLVGEAAVPLAAISGLADWQYVAQERDKRVGMAHSLLNTTAALLMGASLVQRRRSTNHSAPASAQLLSALGYLVMIGGAALGGDLAYRFGIAVNRQAWTEPVAEFTAVMAADELADGEPTSVEVDGRAVLLVRHGEQIKAIGDVCTHMGASLANGTLQDGCVQCPWHGSRFQLDDGSVVRGPATADEPSYAVRIRAGQIEIRSRQPQERERHVADSADQQA